MSSIDMQSCQILTLKASISVFDIFSRPSIFSPFRINIVQSELFAPDSILQYGLYICAEVGNGMSKQNGLISYAIALVWFSVQYLKEDNNAYDNTRARTTRNVIAIPTSPERKP